MIVSQAHILIFSSLLFLMGLLCAVLRKNIILMLVGLEIMLGAAAVAFVGAGLKWQNLDGQSMVVFILAVAATEVAVGLALAVSVYRRTGTLNPDCIEDGACELE